MRCADGRHKGLSSTQADVVMEATVIYGYLPKRTNTTCSHIRGRGVLSLCTMMVTGCCIDHQCLHSNVSTLRAEIRVCSGYR